MILSGHSAFSSQPGEDFSDLPVGVALHGLSKIYGERVAIQNLNVSFYQGHVTSLLGHNGAGKTTTMYVLPDQHVLRWIQVQFDYFYTERSVF